MRVLLIMMAVLAVASCEEARNVDWAATPTSLKVTIVEGQGPEGEVLPLSSEGRQLKLDLVLLPALGEGAVRTNNEVELFARPGKLEGQTKVPLFNGVAHGVVVTLKGAFGDTRIWARDKVTGVTGVSDVIRFATPSVAEVQGDEVCSPMEDEFVVIASGDLVVTGVGTNGMTVSDVSTLDDKGRPMPKASVYVYSFSRPMSLPNCTDSEEGESLACLSHTLVPVGVCDRVRNLAGGVHAFNGYTEFTFPSWELVQWDPGTPCPVPEPFELTELSCNELSGPGLLKYEGALVRVRDVVVDCTNGDACREDSKFVKYGEWYVRLSNGACKTAKLYVVSQNGAPDFDPFAPENSHIKAITGTLKTLYFSPNPDDKCAMGGDFSWIIEPRCPDDIRVKEDPLPVKESCLPVR